MKEMLNTKTDLSFTHSFDGYEGFEIEETRDLLNVLYDKYGISYSIMIQNKSSFTIVTNHLNEYVNIEEYIAMEKSVFGKAHEDLLELKAKLEQTTETDYLDISEVFNQTLLLNTSQLLQEIMIYTDISLSYNTIKIGVDLNGIKPSKKIINFDSDNNDFDEAIEKAYNWVMSNLANRN